MFEGVLYSSNVESSAGSENSIPVFENNADVIAKPVTNDKTLTRQRVSVSDMTIR